MPAYGYTPEPLPTAAVTDYKTRDLPAIAAAGDTTNTRKMWGHGALLHQHQLPACTGFSMAAELIASPYRDDVDSRLGNTYARNHYRRAVYLRHGPELYPDKVDKVGLGIIDVAQVAVERGLIDGYAWARSLAEIRDAVVTVGPVVVGIPWLTSMNRTGDNGLIRCRFSSEMTGSHAIVLTGYDPDAPILDKIPGNHAAFRVRNSWGRSWGAIDPTNPSRRTGTGWLPVDDLARLLSIGPGEGREWYDHACLPLGRNPVNITELLETHPDPTLS